MKSWTLALAALGAWLTATAHAAPVAPPAAGSAPAATGARGAAPPRLVTLSNGLRLLSRTNDSSEIVSIVCLVQAGLPDEKDEESGLAALTGDALIRGSTVHPGQSFDRAVLSAGGNLTALPGFDFTEISIVTSREQFEPALKLIAEVVAHPRFGPEAVAESRERLKRQMAGIRDDFTGASYQSLVGQLYSRSPYGRPMTGSASTLDALTAEDCKRFWQANYVQNRMVVAVVGDVDQARALTLAQKAFQDVPFRPNAVTTPPTRQTLARPKVELIQRPGPTAQLMVGYLAPGATRANYPVYAVLDAVVGGGKRARLFSNIREKHSLGYELGSFYQPLLHQSHLVGYVMTPAFRQNERTGALTGLIDKVRGHLIEQYRQLTVTPPTDAEIARAKAYAVGRYALRQERTRDQAKWLAWNVAMGLGTDFDQHFAARVATVTKEEVAAAAKATLGNYALVVTMPEDEEPEP